MEIANNDQLSAETNNLSSEICGPRHAMLRWTISGLKPTCRHVIVTKVDVYFTRKRKKKVDFSLKLRVVSGLGGGDTHRS